MNPTTLSSSQAAAPKWRNTIVPELRLIEDSLNRSLVPAVGLSPSEYRFRLDISEIEALNDSEDSLVAMQVSLEAAGVMTPERGQGKARPGTRAVGEEPRVTTKPVAASAN